MIGELLLNKSITKFDLSISLKKVSKPIQPNKDKKKEINEEMNN